MLANKSIGRWEFLFIEHRSNQICSRWFGRGIPKKSAVGTNHKCQTRFPRARARPEFRSDLAQQKMDLASDRYRARSLSHDAEKPESRRARKPPRKRSISK